MLLHPHLIQCCQKLGGIVPPSEKLEENSMKKFCVLGASLLLLTAAMADTYTWVGTDSTARFTALENWQVEGKTPSVLPGSEDALNMNGLSANPTISIEDGEDITVARMKLGGRSYGQSANLVVNGGSFTLLENSWSDWGDNKSFLGWHNHASIRVNGGNAVLGKLYVGGQYGRGVVYVSGGTLDVTNHFRVGYFTDNESLLDVSSGTANFKGQIDFGRARFSQSGGTVNFISHENSKFYLGTQSGWAATYELSGGSLAFDGAHMCVGQSSTGIVNQTSGSIVFSASNTHWCERLPCIGDGSSAYGEWNISGGRVDRPRLRFWGYTESYFTIGNSGSGVVRVSGTGSLYNNDWMRLGEKDGSSGTLELNGGVTAVRTFLGGAGTSSVVFNGGVLSPTVANATWFQNIGSLLVKEGGAVISNDFDVTIDHVLASGATHDGGLVKKGASTLTLSAANTFNGPVVIEKGTLKLGCDNAIPAGATVTVKSGATLDLNGKTFTGTIIDESTGTAKAYGAVGLPGVEVLGERLLKNAVGWYDASDTSTLTTDGDTDHVTAWANKAAGGSAYNLAYQGGQTPSSRAESSLNGKTTMSIANTSGYQAKETLSVWTATTPRTMLIVSRRDSGKAFYGMCINDSGTAGAFAIERNDYGTRSGTWDSAYEGSGKYRTVGSIALDEDIWETQVLWGDCQDGKCTVGGYKYNSSSKQTANIEVMSLDGDFGSGPNSRIKLNIGIDYGSHGYGNIAEAAVFDVKLSSDELAEVNAYLNRKWYGENGCRYVGSIASLELTDGSSLDIADTVATIGTLSGMGTVNGSNAMLTVGEFAPVCGDITVNAPVADPAEGEYVTLRITINPANGDCGTLVVPAGYDLSKVNLVVTGCEHLTSANTFIVFKGKAGETLTRFHSVTSDSERGIKLVYDNSTGAVTGSLPKGFKLIIR